MKRRLATLAAISLVALALGATPALASPVQHFSFLATEAGNDLDPHGPLVISCGPNTYTATSGSFSVVTRDSTTAAHITARHVFAVDQDGKSYRVLGMEAYDDLNGRLTAKLMFVGMGGGIADSTNIVARFDDDGNMFVGFDLGTCGF